MPWDPVLKLFLMEKSTCGFREQCTEPIIFQLNVGMHDFCAFQMHTILKTEIFSSVFSGRLQCTEPTEIKPNILLYYILY